MSSRRLPTLPALPTKPTALEQGRNAFNLAATTDPIDRLPKVTTDDDLAKFVLDYVGLRIPEHACCPNHVAPMKALADAYFARYPVCIWEGSRGYAGKSVLLAVLAYCEAVLQGASVNLLGGSGEQAQRVHGYLTGEDTNLPKVFWGNPAAPVYLLASTPEKYVTVLKNGGRIKVLMASQKSVRGPHPQKLRLDEVDEMDLDIFEAALGQTMPARGIAEQIVVSSTHQHANGTFSEAKKMAMEYGWGQFSWCYRESLESNGGWLSQQAVDNKRKTVTNAMWLSEYELQEPAPQERAFMPEKVDAMFTRELGYLPNNNNFYREFIAPIAGARYSTGADWAKMQDRTVIWTWRIDKKPYEMVAIRVCNRLPWPTMAEFFDLQVRRYPGRAGHDATGLGDVLDDFLSVKARGYILVGRTRSQLLSRYITSVERGLTRAPMVELAYREMKFCSNDDLFGTGHAPDTIVAAAIGLELAKGAGWSRPPGGR